MALFWKSTCLDINTFLMSIGLSKQEAAAIIGGATAAGGFALVVVIVLAVLFVKYRIARLLLNRNKVNVGDQTSK